MLRGVYTAASAMLAQETAQSVLANNLANAQTPGYKGDVAAFESFRLAALTRINDGSSSGQTIGELGTGAAPDEIATNLSDGVLQNTGNPLDVAALGNQFFVVRGPVGDRLTRAGAFLVTPDGTLTDTAGHPVIGKSGGPIRVDTKARAAIDSDGNVVVNGQTVDSLRIVALAPGTKPEKEGGRLIKVDPAALRPVDRPRLATGCLEGSNISVVEEMVGMIAAMRAYEAAAKAVQSQDEALGKALNEVARA